MTWQGADLIVNSGKYSLTTSKHAGRVLSACACIEPDAERISKSPREIVAIVEAAEAELRG